jgi:hypothetical protein
VEFGGHKPFTVVFLKKSLPSFRDTFIVQLFLGFLAILQLISFANRPPAPQSAGHIASDSQVPDVRKPILQRGLAARRPKSLAGRTSECRQTFDDTCEWLTSSRWMDI